MPLPTVPYDNNKAPTKDEIMEKLREWIISLKFAPGEKIADTDIAAYFNVSRTPVREVLKVLEQHKLIVTYPGKATVVAELCIDKVEDLYIPMRTLQCLAVRLAVDKATPEDIDELILLNENFYLKMLSRDEDTLGLLVADRLFHNKIEDIAGNEYISGFCSTLWTHVARLDYIFFRDTNIIYESYNDHLEMINAIRIKDPFGAEMAMQNNWTNSMLGIQSLIGKA